MKIKTIPLLFILCLSIQEGNTQTTIGVSRSWSLTIDSSNLQGGPGTDLISTYESNTNQVLVQIQKGGGGWFTNWYWRVDVCKSDLNWPSEFYLDVRRSSNGIGFGSITGGTNYQEVTDTDQLFFTGSRNRILIGLQFRLRGVSLQVVPDTYITTVIYTLTEI